MGLEACTAGGESLVCGVLYTVSSPTGSNKYMSYTDHIIAC